MSLKQDVVLVNEFSIPTGHRSGTRGGTPGDYIKRYMARDGASEPLAPVRFVDSDTYVSKYMGRREAVETMDSVPKIKSRMRQVQGNGGVAFTENCVSLSDEELRRISRSVQKAFDHGKTVMKTVVSFTGAYLKQNGVVSSDLNIKRKGDYRGHVDELKLRLAVMDGMRKLSGFYDDLNYVGIIQVDTLSVHCHLVMVDMGTGKLMPDGTQRGKLSAKSVQAFRTSLDQSLKQMSAMKSMTQSLEMDRANVKSYIKKFTHKAMSERSLPQFLIACLPEDRNLWRAGNKSDEMKKPNELAREFVFSALNKPGSGYGEALNKIDASLELRRRREGLAPDEFEKLRRKGRDQLVKDCVNSVYNILRQTSRDELSVRTPMLDVMATNQKLLAVKSQDSDFYEFGFKLRSYSSRLDFHKKELGKYREQRKFYEQTENPAPESRALYDFYKNEEEYNLMLLCKYQHFLQFLPAKDDWEEGLRELVSDQDKLDRLMEMNRDESMLTMLDEDAEACGRQKYGLSGGRFRVIAPGVLKVREESLQKSLFNKQRNFNERLELSGLTCVNENGIWRVQRQLKYDFNQVKALDLHHLEYDFAGDVQVWPGYITQFLEAAQKRYETYLGAKDYLERSGQGEVLRVLPGRDIARMRQVAAGFYERPVLVSARGGSGFIKKGFTVPLDRDCQTDMEQAVEFVTNNLEFA